MSFIGPSYQLNARKADVQRTVNMFPVAAEVAGEKSVAYLDSIPGLTPFSTDSVVTGYILLEDGFYLLTEDGFRILLGGADSADSVLLEDGNYLITENGLRINL